jgi:hypothetical protein
MMNPESVAMEVFPINLFPSRIAPRGAKAFNHLVNRSIGTGRDFLKKLPQ